MWACVCLVSAHTSSKQPDLKLETRPKPVLGSLPLAFELPNDPKVGPRRKIRETLTGEVSDAHDGEVDIAQGVVVRLAVVQGLERSNVFLGYQLKESFLIVFIILKLGLFLSLL
jgi:hypothetical protein